MKIVGRLFVILLLSILPTQIISAQSTPEAEESTETPFGRSIGAPAYYLDQRGNAILEITVTGIERNWDGFDSYSAPQAGKDYVFVSMTITNLSGRVFIVEPYDFGVVDTLGLKADRAYVSRDNRIMFEDTTVEAEQTIEVGMVFEMFSDLDPLLLIYQPEYDIFVVIYLGE